MGGLTQKPKMGSHELIWTEIGSLDRSCKITKLCLCTTKLYIAQESGKILG